MWWWSVLALAAPVDLSERVEAADPELRLAVSSAIPRATTRDGRPRFIESYLASPEAAALLVRRILEGGDPLPVQTALLRAMDGGADHVNLLHTLLREAAEPEIRVLAVRALGRVRGPEVVPVLREAWGDSDARVRIAVARTVPFAGASVLLPELREGLDDAAMGVRLAAIWALGALRDEASVARLERLETSPDASLADAARRALGRWQTP